MYRCNVPKFDIFQEFCQFSWLDEYSPPGHVSPSILSNCSSLQSSGFSEWIHGAELGGGRGGAAGGAAGGGLGECHGRDLQGGPEGFAPHFSLSN